MNLDLEVVNSYEFMTSPDSRFLAHKKWNLEKAMAAYLDMEEWRRKVGADHILRECPDGKLNSVLPVDMMGFYPYSVVPRWRLPCRPTALGRLRSEKLQKFSFEKSVDGR